MKIALINENSQAPKNKLIYEVLKEVAEPHGHTVYDYGMYSAEDEHSLTYVQNGLLASILLTSKAADFVITGCGTGEGAMLACNSFPNVHCGYVAEPCDAYLFGQINAGNAISMPFAKNFGWGAELNLRYTFEKLFSEKFGGGYPKERAEAEKNNKKILDSVKAISYRSLPDILHDIDQSFLKAAVSGPKFKEYFFANCQDEQIAGIIRKVLD